MEIDDSPESTRRGAINPLVEEDDYAEPPPVSNGPAPPV